MKSLPSTVAGWMEYIQTLHQREIELSLERVRDVYQRLYPHGVPFKVITIAGTNGKGSTAELIASIYRRAGYQVGKYSSPHLVDFNERFSVRGESIADQPLLDAMLQIEQARQTVALTFFEFGTLVAIELFARAQLDIAVMEVGLGGRLDAVNILDPDLTVITNISIDHTAWLGDTIEQIAAEKIAVARADAPCLLGMAEPPAAITRYCQQLDIRPKRLGVDFNYQLSEDESCWVWDSPTSRFDTLALPFSQAGHQLENASLAVAAVVELNQILPVDEQALRSGVADAALPGRCQVVSESPLIVLDVSHNVASVQRLAEFVAARYSNADNGRVLAVCGMLGDKQIGAALSALIDIVDYWHFAAIDDARGISARQTRAALLEYLESSGQHQSDDLQSSLHDNPLTAWQAAQQDLTNNDCLLVFGSFLLVSDIIRHSRTSL